MNLRSLALRTDLVIDQIFGVESAGKLIGDAGIFWAGHIGRFNVVATHREYRRMGVCSTLIYEASMSVFATLGLEALVMEADEDYHAARIYESVGFIPTESHVKLEWRARSQ